MPDPGYEPDWMLYSFLFGLAITVIGWLVERFKTRGERKRIRELMQQRHPSVDGSESSRGR